MTNLSSLVKTPTGLPVSRFEVRVVIDRSERSKYWSRFEDSGRDMMHKMHRNYQEAPGYNSTRLVAVRDGEAVEIVDEISVAPRQERLETTS